jgi:replication factor A1
MPNIGWVVRMLTLEETIELILKNIPDYDRATVLKLIDAKRQELGPEIINDESAAMIVARELGIDLQQVSPKARLKISDITEQTRNVTITVKVVNVGSVRTFSRSGDGGEGKVASLIVADETGKIRVALWDDMTAAVSEEAVTVGSVIQIRNAYVRKGLGDVLELNLGRMGGIRILEDYEIEGIDIKIGEPEETKIADLSDRMFDVAIKGEIQRVFNLSTFTRKSDETEGKVLSIIIADSTGSTRLVFWDNLAEEMESAKEGEVIKVVGAYTKTGRYGDIELHASKSSRIERDIKEEIEAVTTDRLVSTEPLGKKQVSELSTEMRDVDIEGRVARIFPVTTFEKGERKGQVQNIILADESGTVRVTFWNEDVDKIKTLQEGDVIRVKHGYVKEGFRGGVDYQVGRKAEIEINPSDLDESLLQLDLDQAVTQPTGQPSRIAISEIDVDSEGKAVEICGIIVGVGQTKPIYEACPQCRKKMKMDENQEAYMCAACGYSGDPDYRMLYKITLDDGSGSIRITLFGGGPGEQLLGMNAEEAHSLIVKSGNNLAPIEKSMNKILGKYIAVQGRVRKFRDSLDVTASDLKFADPIEEIKRMKENIGQLMS